MDPPEEKRIYIVVPQTVQVLGKSGFPRSARKVMRNFRMEHGRPMAQCAHVARRLENEQLNEKFWDERDPSTRKTSAYKEITTIVLSVRNSRELEKVAVEVALTGGRNLYFPFADTNPEFYGTREKVFTAFAIGQIERSKIDPVLGHLPLYGDQA
jgi:peptidyl-tRNA hydrolase